MFYTASKEQIEQLHPELINYEPEKTRCFYYYDDGTVRWFDRINGYYFSDKPWGLEQEMMAEGIDQEFTEDYLSLNIRNSIKCPDGWSFWCLDYSAEELRLGAINTKGKAFMEAFTSGKDVHTLVGINTFGEEKFYSDKKKYRKIAKTLNFNCNVKDALYLTDRGYLPLDNTNTIQDLEGNNQKFKYFEVEKPTYKVYLSNGNIIEVTKEHKFLDMSLLEPEYREPYVGMCIPMLRYENVKYNGDKRFIFKYRGKKDIECEIPLNRELGYLIGYYLGDGYINNNVFQLCAKPSNKDYLIELLNKYFPLFKYYKNNNGVHIVKETNTYCNLYVTSSVLTAFILQEFKDKTIPNWVYYADKDFASGIIDGLFDSDGTNCNHYMQLDQTRYKLHLGVAKLLSYLGIPAISHTYYYKYKGEKKPLYRLKLYTNKYLDLHTSKKDNLNKGISSYLGYSIKPDTYIINNKYDDRLNQIYNGRNLKVSCNYLEKHLPSLSHNNYYPVYITKLEESKNTVYVMECDTHKYIAEGVINHNCQYGGTPFGVARLLGVPMEEAQKIYDDYMLAMKDHFDVQDMQVAITHQTGCEHTFFGLPIRLKRYYMNPNDRKNIAQGERLARNCRIQGCLNYETLVLTNKGYIQIGELYDNWNTYKDTGIKVWTGDSWTRFYPSYMGKASKYKITFSNGQEFYCDNRHKIKVFTDNEIEWKCVTDYDNTVPTLQIGDNVCFNVPKQFDFPITHTSIIGEKSTSDNPKYKEDIIFDREDILDMCYMYGSILGDGNIDPITKTIRHCWGYTKFDNIDKFTKLLNKYNMYFPIREKYKSDRNHITKDTEFCCTPLVNAMCKLFGITEYENVYTKKLHKEIYKFDLEMIRQILLGLYDTDGTKLTAELHLCNKELLLGVQKLLWIVGYNSHIKKYKCENNAYMLIILGHKGKDYIHWLHTGEYTNSYSSSTLAYHKNLFKEKLVKPYIYATESERASIFKVLNNKNVSLNMFRSLCKQNNILFEDYEYNTVIAVENCNEEIDTYELTVEDPRQQFIAEDIVNHNTGADILSIAFMKLWSKIWRKLGNPEDYIRFQVTVHDLGRNLVVYKQREPMLKGCH